LIASGQSAKRLLAGATGIMSMFTVLLLIRPLWNRRSPHWQNDAACRSKGAARNDRCGWSFG
jgi:hypothetical protein